MTGIVLEEVESQSQLLCAVLELANGPAKRTLGLLPDQGFADRARKGTLLAAVIAGRLVGYVLYDLPRQDVKVVQLCVAPDARRIGVARALVEEVCGRHQDRVRLMLACRRDYEANPAWKALGFRPQGSRPGRSKAGHLLTIWVRGFGHPTLFDVGSDDRPRAALDHNVFLDLHLDARVRPQGVESRYLLDDWIAEYVELCVTDEIFHEIHQHEDADERVAQQQWASEYRNVSAPSAAWEGLVSIVARLAPAAGDRDHRHVARAAAGGAAYLVSRDGELLKAATGIEETLAISVLRPEALIVRLDATRSESPYQPADLQGTALRQFAPPDRLHDEVIAALLNHGAGERLADLRSRLRPSLADPAQCDVRIVQTPHDRTVAGFVRRSDAGRLEIPLLRVVPGWRGAHVVARQLVFAQRRHAADHGLSQVVVTDAHLPRDVLTALPAESFEEIAGGWSCDVQTGVVVASDGNNADSNAQAAEAEVRCWPPKVLGAGIPTYMVAITVAFAEALLDPHLAAQSLLPRQVERFRRESRHPSMRTAKAPGVPPVPNFDAVVADAPSECVKLPWAPKARVSKVAAAPNARSAGSVAHSLRSLLT